MSVYLPVRVWTLDPYMVPREDVDPQLVTQSGLPRVPVGRKGVPLWCDSLLEDAGVRAINGHHAVVDHDVRAFCS